MLIDSTALFGFLARTIALSLMIIFVIPAQIREVRVINGLSWLRHLMLGIGIIITFANVVPMIYYAGILTKISSAINSDIVSMSNSALALLVACGFVIVYHKRQPRRQEGYKKRR